MNIYEQMEKWEKHECEEAWKDFAAALLEEKKTIGDFSVKQIFFMAYKKGREDGYWDGY